MRTSLSKFVELLLICRAAFSAVQLEKQVGFSQTYNDVIAEIDKSHSSCIVHLVHLTKEVELSTPSSFPIVLDLWTTDWEMVTYLSKSILREEGIRNLTEKRFKSTFTTAKIQRFSCFITLIVLPGLSNPFVTDLFQREYPNLRVRMLQILLRSSNIVCQVRQNFIDFRIDNFLSNLALNSDSKIQLQSPLPHPTRHLPPVVIHYVLVLCFCFPVRCCGHLCSNYYRFAFKTLCSMKLRLKIINRSFLGPRVICIVC